MNNIYLWAVMLGIAFAVAGCESVSERLQARFAGEPPHVQVFPENPDVVFEVTKQVLREMGFRSIRGRVRSLKLTAVSRVKTNDTFSGASQVTVKVLFGEASPGETEMQVWMTEVVEDEFTRSGGYGTQMPLQGDLLYNMLFQSVGARLGEGGK